MWAAIYCSENLSDGGVLEFLAFTCKISLFLDEELEKPSYA